MPVPRHWSQKRKYLQGKRGLEKPPFKLPEFIEATGISEMRQAYQEKVLARWWRSRIPAALRAVYLLGAFVMFEADFKSAQTGKQCWFWHPGSRNTCTMQRGG